MSALDFAVAHVPGRDKHDEARAQLDTLEAEAAKVPELNRRLSAAYRELACHKNGDKPRLYGCCDCGRDYLTRHLSDNCECPGA